MKLLPTAVACGLLLAPMAALAQVPVALAPDQQALLKSPDPQVARNKKLVFDFWREVFQARDMERADHYMAEDYIQHNPTVATGRAPFKAFFGRFPKQPVKPTIDDLVSLTGDGDLVVLAFRRTLPDPRTPGATYTTTWFDMLRVKGDKIVEHWDYGTIAPPGPAAAPR
jgi:predicted SnoaL-like aldol condensation-catalyzing enzyme